MITWQVDRRYFNIRKSDKGIEKYSHMFPNILNYSQYIPNDRVAGGLQIFQKSDENIEYQKPIENM